MKKNDVSIEQFVKLGPWPGGIDNQHDPSRLKEGYLVAANNVDIDDSGMISRRDGTTIVCSMSAHSIIQPLRSKVD